VSYVAATARRRLAFWSLTGMRWRISGGTLPARVEAPDCESKAGKVDV